MICKENKKIVEEMKESEVDICIEMDDCKDCPLKKCIMSDGDPHMDTEIDVLPEDAII
jgi:hypothetical protein